MEARPWVSVHVFYDGDLDLLVTDLVADAVTRLDAEAAATGLFFLRYWEAGPHLRIRVLPAPGRRDDVRRIVTETAARFLERRPAPALVDQDDYAEYAPAFAAAESRSDYARVRRPNNSFAHLPYVPETHKYGTGDSLHAAEDHFVTCSATARELLTAGVSDHQRTTAGFAVLALSWWAGLLRGGTLPVADHRVVDPGDEPTLADHFHRQRETLLTVADKMRGLAAAPLAGPTGTLGTWARAVGTLADRIEEPSALWRVLDNCAHLTCNRLGVLPAVEGELRYFGYRTFAELVPHGRLAGRPATPLPLS